MSIQNVNNSEFAFLSFSSAEFRENNETKAYVAFSAAPDYQKNKVYEQIWVDKGTPAGDPQYGQHAFYNQFGYRTLPHERAKAIDKVISFYTIPNADPRMHANGMFELSAYERWVKEQKDYADRKDYKDRQEKNSEFKDKYTPPSMICNVNELSSDQWASMAKGAGIALAVFALAIGGSTAVVHSLT